MFAEGNDDADANKPSLLMPTPKEKVFKVSSSSSCAVLEVLLASTV
jgi:hypothetical protein